MKIMRFDNLKLFKAFFGLLAVASFAVPVFLFYHYRILPIENNHKNISQKQHPRPRYVIHGFSFNRCIDNIKELFSDEPDKVERPFIRQADPK